MKITSSRRKLWQALGIIGLCVLSFAGGLLVNGWVQNPDEKLVDAAFRLIANDLLFSPLSQQELAYAAVRGMISPLNDPYAELIEPQAAANFTNTFAGKTGVTGLYAENQSGQVVITIVFPGGSAEKAGVKMGDELLSIDGVSLDKDTDSSEAGLMLRGEPDTTVHLQVKRQDQVLDFDLVRQIWVYVNSRMLENGIGYISLNAYNRTASQQMKTAIETLMAENPRGLVWDLRNNEGGDMQAAQEILSYFIKDGLLFTAELTQGRTVEFKASGKPIAGEIPLMVLMDKTTYSAAETSSAAVAETGRGTTIGSTSYGKGVIQATVPLPEGAMLQLTIARWLSPHGEWYHQRGVTPMIEAHDDPATDEDELLQKAIEILLSK